MFQTTEENQSNLHVVSKTGLIYNHESGLRGPLALMTEIMISYPLCSKILSWFLKLLSQLLAIAAYQSLLKVVVLSNRKWTVIVSYDTMMSSILLPMEMGSVYGWVPVSSLITGRCWLYCRIGTGRWWLCCRTGTGSW